MPDRGRLLAAAGVIALVVATYFDLALLPLGILAFTVAFAYAGYWGYAVSRGLIMTDYRNQALGVGLSAFYFVFVDAVTGAVPVTATSDLASITTNALVDSGMLLVLFYWVITTVALARRSDPFERDTFHIRLAKYVWALALVLPIAVLLAYNPIALVFTVATPVDTISLALALASGVALIPFGIALLLVSAFRSRDRTLRSHIKWYAGALAAFLLVFLVGGVWHATGGNSSPYAFIIGPLFLGPQFIAAYCFYRSAKSLAPMTKSL
jgi:hypothetical protein